ncbi:MAG TPA: M28 family peptidase [Longimicrobiales bacterium]|nr:M28 family peptidase [Longimicrobiales bacterium]
MTIARAMLLLFVLPQLAAAQTVDTMALRAHTRFLSADALRGRGAGTPGEQVAAEYIASELMRMGVKPVAGSYFQQVPLKRARITHARARFGGQSFGARDFVWNTGGPRAFRAFGGPVTFVGAIDTTAVRRADEARNRVVVLTGPMGAAALTYVPALQRAGAAGVIIAISDSTLFQLFVRSRGDGRFFVNANVNDPVWQADLPVVIAGPELARRLIARDRFTTMPGQFSAELQVTVEDVQAANVVGIIPGNDPRLANQVVAFSAHYDHLGVSIPDARGDSIYNGFSDNAAGVAMLLAMADALRKSPIARSVLLLFFTAEERGLLGSSFYAAYPLLPLERMTALINLDAGAPPAPPVSWRIAGGQGTSLGQVARDVAAANRWTADLTAATPNSDYWPFVQRGVPGIFVIPGNQWENTDAQQQAALRLRWDRYHRADDEWHPDFPFSGLARYAEMALAIGKAAR